MRLNYWSRNVGRCSLLVQVICLPSGPNVQRLYSSRCCAFSWSFQYPSSIVQSMGFCLGLPLPLSPSILPSIISFCRELPLRMCPIQFFCLVLITCRPTSVKDLFSSTFFNTSSFVLCSVQLVLSVLLHIHISEASICLTSSFLIVHVCAPYTVTLHTRALTILFLMSLPIGSGV